MIRIKVTMSTKKIKSNALIEKYLENQPMQSKQHYMMKQPSAGITELMKVGT